MSSRLGTADSEDGVGITHAEVNGFKVVDLRFPPGYGQPWTEPDTPYLAVVLDGSLVKTFRCRTLQLSQAHAVTMPSGEGHDARFGPRGARIVTVKARGPSAAAAGCLSRLASLRRPGLAWLAWRLAAELEASDAAAPLAAEGLALELFAAASRETSSEQRRARRPPRWLGSLEELLREHRGDRVRLRELSAAVGVDPSHVARAFRAHHGMSIGEYARRSRVAWAAAELARTDIPLAVVARRAGFADQSHFTRLFRRYVGTTPGRYRHETQRGEGAAG